MIDSIFRGLDYVAKGKVRVMTGTFRLKKLPNTYDKVANGNVRFKAVIEPGKLEY
jgi:alcohol dehydrogenase